MLVLAVACFSQQPAVAAEIEGVQFAERVNVGDAELELRGTGLLRYRVIFKGYVAAFYLGKASGETTASDVLGDVPRRLEIEYFWPIPAEKFAEVTDYGISRNIDPATLESLRERIEEFSALYEDIEPGDRYVLTYVPGIGTELARNGRTLGVVEGADFSASLFAIWLGDQPLDDSLREQLLARQ
jgi:hypothetical protein